LYQLATALTKIKSASVLLSTFFSRYFLFQSLNFGSSSALCQAFARLGARGTSVLVASGDGGVAGSRPNNTCTTFVPTLPANCPYITAVGATQGNPIETGADLSAGGFSNYYARPLYQYIEVEGYLAQLGSTYRGLYNASSRAYPDVSAQGKNLVIVKGGKEYRVDGTSASAPIFASVISLLNERLLRMGRQPLGFLNPLIYLFPEIFNDITSGNNPSCGTNGFPAKKGWDPVTGLGTPDFEKFAAAILAF
jgi:tripeptidyl-peptidase-1